MAQDPYANQRRHIRVDEAVRVRFQFMRAPSTLSHLGQIDTITRNISEGGVFIELNRQNKLKDDPASIFALLKCPIEMEIFITEAGTPIKVQGKAVWVEKKVPGQEASYARGVAVQFTNISTYDSSIIRQFVASVVQETG